jgi:hypothetical protein
VDLPLEELIKQLELFEEHESGRDDENRTYWNPPPDTPYPPPDRREEMGKKLIGKLGFWAFAALCAHSTRTGLPEAEFATRLRDSLATRLECSPKEIGQLDVLEAIEQYYGSEALRKFYGSIPLSGEPSEAPPPAPSGPTDATEEEQGPETSAEHTTPLPEVPSDSGGCERVQPAIQPAVLADAPIPVDPGVWPLFLPNQHIDVLSHEPPEWNTPEALANLAALIAELKAAGLAGFRSPTGEPIPPTEPLITIATQLEALGGLREEKSKGNLIIDGCPIVDLIELLTLQLTPVFAHERFRAYCNAKHGSYPTATVVRKLIGTLILEHGFSEDRANRATLDEALDIVMPKTDAKRKDTGDSNAAPKGDGAKGVRKKRRYRAKGEAKEALASTLLTLANRGDWGWEPKRIIGLADISRSQFYELTNEDEGDEEIKLAWAKYKNRSLGRGPCYRDTP